MNELTYIAWGFYLGALMFSASLTMLVFVMELPALGSAIFAVSLGGVGLIGGFWISFITDCIVWRMRQNKNRPT